MARQPGRKAELNDINTLMSTPAGSRFIWRLLTLSGVFRSSFSSDPLVMGMNEGQRNIGLRLLSDVMEACPDKYLNMMKSKTPGGVREAEDVQHLA